MTHFRHEARGIIRTSVGASTQDAVILCGSGATGPIQKLVYHVMQLCDGKGTPVVFVGPFEHHSNILPWRESGAKVLQIVSCTLYLLYPYFVFNIADSKRG